MAQQHNNRNSPHLNHLQHNGSAPSSPSMSGSQQGNQQRQPVNYPSPTSYPSPSLSTSQYNYPPPGNQNEPYRASPTGSNGSLSLPSMRSLDPLQQQQQQQQQQAAQHQHMGSPLPPPVAQMGGPYYQNQLPHPSHQHQYPNVTSDPNMRYALPVDSRVMSGGRHKKEIKRRTKTGCLTCRKRRIKCDEQHPACRNCQKSKRECLGYDPIFKQQPGPAPIQPAPSSAPSQASSLATANPYGNQPQMLQTGYGVPATMSYDPALTAPSAAQHYDYSSAIDPNLEASAPIPVINPFHSTPPAQRSIDDLLAFGNPPAPVDSQAPDVSQSPSALEEAKHLYYSIYSPGLESFLESKWFSAKGAAKLMSDKPLLEKFGTLLLQFSKTIVTDPVAIAHTASVEAKVVWALACMVKLGAEEEKEARAESKSVLPAQDDAVEANHRLTVFECLLTGKVAESNQLTAPVQGSGDHHRLRELEFWYSLANFVCLREDDPNCAKDVDDTLATLRNLLDGRENRDVLYSIAIIRAIGQRVSEYTPSDTPLHFDESDNRSKLLVAKKFVQDEASGSGTTNVIRRLCELATRTWTTPAPLVPIPK
ncbi:552427a6-ee9b-4412-bc16-d4df6503a8d8 [Sclerotinia trifoliorum]|uniref:552427a6-ee9b-4412-bc16-d4df6503a8d8 n=1 Tax=Sclerotinia trifoliorum TaxID=28548 RepID=A0A8H2VWS5_9HELO|nr:552427a6-ee9b-4412-bc16-d4df6503a8d8 [Sclerotinia trifoliorum]